MFGLFFLLFFDFVGFCGADEMKKNASPANQSANSKKEVKSSPDTDKKKWKLSFSHAINKRAALGSRSVLINSVSGRYLYSKNLFFSSSLSYTFPLKDVVDTSPYGWTDTSLSASFPLSLPKSFLAKKWNGSLGITLPTSHNARKAGKWLSFFGSIQHPFKQTKNYILSGGHTLYMAGFYKYLSNATGSQRNSLISSFHSLNFTYKYKQFSFAALGRFYLSASLRNKSSDSLWQRIYLQPGQGFKFTCSYTLLKPKMTFFGQSGINIPFISPVLTGFLLGEEYWVHLLGISWKL